MPENQISPIQKDALKEVINIGAGNASTALSKLISKKVLTSVPELNFCRVEEVSKNIDDLEKLMTVVLLQTKEVLPGTILLLFSPEGALELTEVLTQKRYNNIKELDEFGKSALCEVGNILVGACASALSNFLGLNIVSSVPDVATDMVGSLLNAVLVDMGQAAEEIFEFKVDFNVEDKKISGRMMFMFTPEATEKILATINTKI